MDASHGLINKRRPGGTVSFSVEAGEQALRWINAAKLL